MHFFLSLLGIVASFFLLKYRERVGDMIGEADWMRKVGGIYMIIIFVAIFIFFWSVAELTGTTGVLFGWVRYVIPGLRPAAAPPEF